MIKSETENALLCIFEEVVGNIKTFRSKFFPRNISFRNGFFSHVLAGRGPFGMLALHRRKSHYGDERTNAAEEVAGHGFALVMLRERPKGW